LAQAYAPYSNYAVGAAIAAMIAGGEREISEVFVMTAGDTPGMPCGGMICLPQNRPILD